MRLSNLLHSEQYEGGHLLSGQYSGPAGEGDDGRSGVVAQLVGDDLHPAVLHHPGTGEDRSQVDTQSRASVPNPLDQVSLLKENNKGKMTVSFSLLTSYHLFPPAGGEEDEVGQRLGAVSLVHEVSY